MTDGPLPPTSLRPVDFDPFAESHGDTFELTEQQREMYAATLMGDDANCAYNQCFALRLRGPLSEQSLRSALMQVVQRHEALRLRISNDDQRQQILESIDVSLPVVELSGTDATVRNASIAQILDHETRTPFDLAIAPLWRAQLIREAADLHRLIFTAHHLIVDGWSSAVIFGDLARAYATDRFGLSAQQPAAAAYREFITGGQSPALAAQALAAEEFWAAQFADGAPTLELPSDRPRPRFKSYAAARRSWTIDNTLYQSARRMGAQQGATLFVTLLAAFEVLVARLSSSEDLVVGVPMASQALQDNGHLVAHGVNTIPLRCRVNMQHSFAEHLRKVRVEFLDALAHQHLTFGTLVHRLRLPRDPSRNPLVSVIFNIDRIGSPFDFGDVDVEGIEAPKSFYNFEFGINALDDGESLLLECDYNSDLFDTTTIGHWLEAYEVILRAAVADDAQTLGRLGMLSPRAYQELLDLQPARTICEHDVLMHEFIERQIDQTPRRPALTFSSQTISYAELDARANGLANLLRTRGIKRGALVGLCLERSADMVVAQLGILKSGAAYVPLDPAYPAERLSYMAKDAKLALMVSHSSLANVVDWPRDATVLLDSDAALLKAQPAIRPAPDPALDAAPEDPAYAIYTSGSTGKPKGVVIPHRAVVNFLASMAREPGLTASDRIVAVTTLSFDIAVLELLLPLSVGAEVVLASRDDAMSGSSLRALLEESGATVMQATPGTWQLLIEAGWQGSPGFKALVGGESLRPDLAQQLLDRSGELWNMYGPTETTVWSTCCKVERPERGISIGRPIANTQVHIFDAYQQPCPIGVTGEIVIGGEGVALGYLNQPDLTSERFIVDPLDPQGQRRLYRTGDRGRWCRDGMLEHLGRLDAQVKVRGYRIEPGEIETNLRAHSSIAQAIVIAREDTPGDQRLVAYIVPRGPMPSAAELREHLRGMLPHYMVPQDFVTLEAIPLLPNGKLNRTALPTSTSSASERSKAHIAPRNEGERRVAAVMEQALGQAGLSVDDDFFQLGGHSLLAARMAMNLSRDGDPLPLRAIFDAPTIEQLAAWIARHAATGARRFQPIVARASQALAPTSLMQERIWFLEQFDPDRPTYNVPFAYRLSGALDIAALERAFNTMIQRQAVLRTEIAEVEGTPVQCVVPELCISLGRIEDLSHLPAERRDEALDAALRMRVAELIDFRRAPLFKLALFRCTANEHVLFFMPHHLIWDGASTDLFHEELAALYGAYSQGLEPRQPALPVTYGDFAQWQQAWLGSDDFREQLEHWKALLTDLPEPLELPLDERRPKRMSGQGGNEQISFEPSLVEDARRLGQTANATLFMTLLAVYAAMLSRITSQSDFIIGTPVRGRHSADVEKVLGFFVNALPLRIKVSPEQPFGELLRHVRDVVLDAFSHPDAPFERLVREIDVARDESRSPVYQTLFSFQDARHRVQRWGNLAVQEVNTVSPGSQVDLGLWFVETTEGLSGDIQYNTDIINADSARRVRRWFASTLRSVVATPELPVCRVPLVSDDEAEALRDWNATRLEPALDRTLSSVVEARVALDPSRRALRSGAEVFTYGELDARANGLANLLRTRGIKRGALVGLCLERSADMVVAQLGILKSGAAYVPLDPAYPAERLSYMAKDAKLALMVSHSSLANVVDWPRDATVLLDSDAALLKAQPAIRPAPDPALDAAPEDPAYAIYTSGSTGKPKGVVIPHRAVVNFLASMAREPGLTASDRIVAVTTLSFDIAVLELLLPLSVGAEVVLASRDDAMSGSSLRALLEESGATVMQATPGTWQLLIEAGWQGSPGFKALVGGESLRPDLAQQLLDRSGELWNMYGPTETTVWSTCCKVERPERGISIGRPIANTQVHIFDAYQQPCPIGVTGEIVIGGEGVALGYLNQPDLTSERFIVDPLDPQGQRRLYRTGDRGRWCRDGMLEHLGRLDAQVKVRGYRIEPGEIETNLRAHSSIAQAIVIAREDTPGDQRLVAYIVPRGPMPSAAELREHLRGMLPHYMVPQDFVTLEAIPLLPNGKLNRTALPTSTSSASERSKAHIAPRNEGERRVAAVMEQALGQAGLSVDDDFFQLGGHSLLAARMAMNLSRDGDPLPLRAIFDAPTIEQLAAWIARHAATGARRFQPIVARASQALAPTSLMQERIWFLEQFDPDRPTYNVPFAYRLSGALDIAALERAFNTMIQRQAVLRTEIAEVEGTPVQCVVPELCISLGRIEDLSHLPAERRDEALDAALRMRVAELIDFRRAPLFKLALFRCTANEHVLFFMPHHLIWDGASTDLFHEELAALYGAYSQGLEPRQPALPVTYGDFAQWQQAWLGSDDFREQLEHWKALLTDLPEPLELPLDERRPKRMSGQGGNEQISFEPSLVEDARRLGQTANATLFMTLLAVYAAMLSRITSQSDFIIGTPVRGRHSADVEKVLGFFVNALPLRIKVSPEQPFGELLRHVRDVVLDAFSHPDAPFERLVREIDVARDESRSPVYQTLFSFQDARHRVQRWGNLAVQEVNTVSPGSQVDLGLWFVETTEGLSGDIQYNTDIINADSARRVRRWFASTLRSVVATPELPVCRVPLVSDDEAEALRDWNATRLEPALDRTLSSVVEARVALDPSRRALRSGAEVFTYGELDARANGLANLLRTRGIKRGALVGLCLERSADMVVAQLGILKSGAAYVPLDPAYPAERLSYMAKDAKLALMVSHSSLANVVDWPRDATVLLDSDAALLKAQPAIRPAPDPALDAAPEDPAYAIYTSGSTGKPKGVVIPHRAVVNFLASMAREPGLTASDRIVAVTTLSFDIAVLELLLPLSVGAEVVLASRDDAMSGSSLRALLEESGATVMQATPGTWQLLIEAGWQGSPGFKALVGGESLRPDLAQQLLDRSGELWNMYGPTETTVWSTCCKVERPERGISIGRPIANTQVHIFDAYQQPCPIGVTGEIVIGGEGVALGYLNQPDLTSERFIVDPLDPQGQRRLYRTGDRGRWCRDGMLEHLGRLDAQVKVRGYRIEPGEIETNLRAHSSIAQAIVIAREDTPGDQRLVAYIVPRGPMPSAAELREHLRGMLPHYMVPQDFVTLEAIPLLPNGKLNRTALPTSTGLSSDSGRRSTAPRTASEKLVVAAFADALNRRDVGVRDNFFDLGGHSLMAARVMAMLRITAKVDLPLRNLFEWPTPEGLANVIDALVWTADSTMGDAGHGDREEIEL